MTTNNNTVSLYIHFPFCIKKCAYCAFFSSCHYTESSLEEYTSAVIRRIEKMPESNIRTIYFGGGTPTVLNSELLVKILQAVFKHHRVIENAEITLEANPGTVEKSDFRLLRNGGFNRLSLGLQSANDGTLKLIGRLHDKNCFLRCYDEAQAYFDNFSVDIMFALPGDDLNKTLETVISLAPRHISAYSLILEKNTKLFRGKDKYTFPSEDEEETQYFAICSVFSDYEHYEISSFAKKGFESKHNIVYWERGDYIGIGPSAHSFYNNRRFFTPNDTKLFIKNSELDFLHDTSYFQSFSISSEEAEEERIMLGLRTKKGVFLDEKKLKKAKKYVIAGYGEINGSIFSLNDKGYRISNSIIADIIV